MASSPPPPSAARAAHGAAMTSLVGGVVILAAKLLAWWLTGSAAVLSDALESVVNVLAAGFALFAVRLAAEPADANHPYGHGKIEHISAVFEGGLVTLAAAAIIMEGVAALVGEVTLRRLDAGLLITAGAGAANLALGAYLVSTGRRHQSAALVADGKHVLSDVWTTLGVLLGLMLVRLTGLSWLDPLTALILGGLLAATGLRLVRQAADALMDREDPELIARIKAAFAAAQVPGFAGLHQVRAIRAGALIHVDAHVYVPAHWTVREGHDAALRLEAQLKTALHMAGEVALHLDPHPGAEVHPGEDPPPPAPTAQSSS